jgi:TolB protein
MTPREHQPGQRSQLWTADVSTGTTQLLLESTDVLIEAPNWTLDGAALIVNGAGRLWSVPLAAPELIPVPLTGCPDLNNDHVLAPDGRRVYVSANDWHIYEAQLAGGPVRRVTGEPPIQGLMHFLHGVSPDGERLAFVGLEPDGENLWARANIFTMSVGGGDHRQITDTPHPADGCEYSPDGRWLYFNTEQFSGHAQLARVPVDGGTPQRLRSSDTVDWFPHLSADGHRATFVAFPPGTAGHPADVWVDVLSVELPDWQNASVVARVFGGQGTLNVNSWAPDGDRFAYVAYPIETGTRHD